ncbi:MAG TPA: molybdenum cofactor biosynthesis protein MoaE [Verrucomicrobiota bacterium]|nr:molybdenum cofactor biosynthesis protein MoaE [Verrucomicrobiales bacterium]HRI15838.1 molybdenum cofactor biosynthesis protein MoaE [Verrucomicrobiota bacterium]
MKRLLTLTTEPLDESRLVSQRHISAGSGAVCSFVGIVRAHEEGAVIEALEYEAFEPMVRRQFDLLFEDLARRWPAIESVRLIHRLGCVPVNQSSLWVEVVAPHRAEAFAACQWLIDEMKRLVPIWKRPTTSKQPGVVPSAT